MGLLECENCGNDEISREDLDLYSSSEFDINCPACGGTTMKREIEGFFEPE